MRLLEALDEVLHVLANVDKNEPSPFGGFLELALQGLTGQTLSLRQMAQLALKLSEGGSQCNTTSSYSPQGSRTSAGSAIGAPSGSSPTR